MWRLNEAHDQGDAHVTRIRQTHSSRALYPVKRETLAGSLSLSISMCGRPRTDRNITDKSNKEHARGTGQIPVLAIEHVNWNACLQMCGTQRSKPQFLVDATFRQKCNPDTCLD